MDHNEVRERREALGLSKLELAAIMCVHRKTVDKWERDPNQDMSTAIQIPELPAQVLRWMTQTGRPKGWPKTNKGISDGLRYTRRPNKTA